MLPGARDSYIDLGRFYDAARLEKRRAELTELTRRYKNAYVSAYGYLSAAGALNLSASRRASDELVDTASKNCAALLPVSAPESGAARKCFIDAVCCKGQISLWEEFGDWRIYTISASPADGDAVLRRLGMTLSANKYGVTCCPSPLEPSLLQHILIPTHKTLFTLARREHSPCAAALSVEKPDERLFEHHDALLGSALEMLALAKRSHDALEEVYNPCVDFGGIYAEAKKHIDTIL